MNTNHSGADPIKTTTPGIEAAKPLAHSGRLKWYHIYFLLAAFDLFAVSCGLFLTHRLVRVHKNTVQVSLQWVARITQADALAKDAGEVATASGDAYQSLDVKSEAFQMQESHTDFEKILTALRDDVRQNVSLPNRVTLLKDCAAVEKEMGHLILQTDSTFSSVREGNLEAAASKVANAGREYEDVLQALTHLRVDLRACRHDYLVSQLAESEKLARYEWVLGGLIIFMVAGTTLYGVRLQRHMSASSAWIRESEEKYRSLFERMHEGFALCEIICDSAGTPCDFRYLEVNSAFEDIIDLKPSAVVGKRAREMFPQIEDYWIETYGKVALTGEPARFEHYFGPLNRHFEVTASSPKPGQFAAIFMDITARKRADEALRKSEDQYRVLVETTNTGFVIIDNVGKILDANAEYVRLTGHSDLSQVKGRNVIEWTAGHEKEKNAESVRVCLQQGYIRNLEIDYVDSQGHVTPVEINASVLERGGTPRIVALCRDITERKHAQLAQLQTNRRLEEALANLNAAQQQVVQQERLRALGTMASGVAHDFNNALAAILGFTELLLHKPDILDDKEKARRYIEMMNVAAKDAGHVVDRLREFYRHREEADVLLPIDLNQLVQDAVSLTEPKWKAEAEIGGKSIVVKTDLKKIPDVAGNASELREVLTNLILNAVDAMPCGGTINFRTCRDDGHVVLEVSDTGTGMTEEVRRRCLEPFFSTKGDHGTGLGLSMVYGIVERHGGNVDICSEGGKGTTFIIRLPHQENKSSPQPQQPDNEPLPEDSAQSLHVLIVDDEVAVRTIVGEYLMMDGHTVVAASSGREGLDKFRSDQFDLVMVDRAMPDMDGDQVAEAIKSADPSVPVVMLTGFGGIMDGVEKPAGVDLIVGKPVTILGLRAALAEAGALKTTETCSFASVGVSLP